VTGADLSVPDADSAEIVAMRSWAGTIGCVVVAVAMVAGAPLPTPPSLAGEGGEGAPACVTDGPARPPLPSADVVPDVPAAPGMPQSPADPSVQSGAGLPACLAWTDGCVTCQRAAGKIACSNIGIACQPQAPQCLQAAPADRN
jgi:hypothetical protein